MTNIVQAEVDGHSLTDEEVGVHGAAGPRPVTTHHQTDHRPCLPGADRPPDQLAWLREDVDGRIGGAVDEFVRWGTPVMQFTRTATRDTELAGTKISEGRQGRAVLLLEGNFDSETFDNPEVFSLDRFPTSTRGFGGGVTPPLPRQTARRPRTQTPLHRAGHPHPRRRVRRRGRLTYSDFVHGVKHA